MRAIRVWSLVMALLVWGGGCAGSAQAVTRYADNSIGNCPSSYNPATRACSGGTAQSFATLSACVASLAAGDTCYIRSGTYAEGLYIYNKVGTASQRITVAGYPGDVRPILRPPSSWSNHVLTTQGEFPWDNYLTIKDLQLDGINLAVDLNCGKIYTNHTIIESLYCVNAPRSGFDIFASNNVVRHTTIENCGRIQPSGITDTKGGSFYVKYSDNIIEHNVIDGCRVGGMVVQCPSGECGTSRNNIVRYNVFKNGGILSHWPPPAGFLDQSGTGINVGASAQGTKIYNNIFAHIRQDPVNTSGADARSTCLYVYDGAQDTEYYNNTCVDFDTGIWAEGFSSGTIARNNLLSNVTTATVGGGGVTSSNNIYTADITTTFVNAAADDFHLAAGATAIDAGMTVPLVTDDFEGRSRPQGNAYDIGAYEASSAVPPPTFSVAVSPPTLPPGQTVTIVWSVSTPRPPTDWVGLFLVDTPNTAVTDGLWQYTGGATTGTVSFLVSTPGTYEVRYLLENGYTDVARSQPVEVRYQTGVKCVACLLQ